MITLGTYSSQRWQAIIAWLASINEKWVLCNQSYAVGKNWKLVVVSEIFYDTIKERKNAEYRFSEDIIDTSKKSLLVKNYVPDEDSNIVFSSSDERLNTLITLKWK